MTTATQTPLLPGMFAWHCGRKSSDGTTCIARGDSREDYDAHMRGHGLKQLHPAIAPIRLTAKAPAARLSKPAVANVLADLTWTEADGTEARGQFWCNGESPRTVWVVPYELVHDDYGTRQLACLRLTENGAERIDRPHRLAPPEPEAAAAEARTGTRHDRHASGHRRAVHPRRSPAARRAQPEHGDLQDLRSRSPDTPTPAAATAATTQQKRPKRPGTRLRRVRRQTP